jgi:hypothetical protein
MGYSRLNIGSCGTIFFFCILLELLNGLTVQAKTLPMQWSPLTIEQAIRPGDTLTVTAMLTSKNALHNVDLWIAPELDPLVTVFPNHFDAIRANTTHAVDIHISIPYLSSTGLYEGTIHIKKNAVTFPQALKIKLNIIEAPLYDNWMITFTHRGVPLSEEAVRFICDSVNPEIISWLIREASTYQQQIPFRNIECFDEQILLKENLLAEDNPGLCLNRPEVINFLENMIPAIKNQKFVSIVHYLGEYDDPFFPGFYDSRYDFYFFKQWLPLYPPLGIDRQGESLVHELMHKLGASDKYFDRPDHACKIDPETGEEYNGYDIMCHRVPDPSGGYSTPALSDLIISEPTAREIGWLP